MADKVRKLKDAASRHLNKGRNEKALEALLQVVRLEPRDLPSRQRCGDLYRKLGQKNLAIRSYQAVAGAYAADGFLLKAIAVSKVILQLDPKHTETQKALAELYARKRGSSLTAELPAVMSAALGHSAAAAAPSSPQTSALPTASDAATVAQDAEQDAALDVVQAAPHMPQKQDSSGPDSGLEVDAPNADDLIFDDDDDDDGEIFELDFDLDQVEDSSPQEIDLSSLPPIPLFSDLEPKIFIEFLQRMKMTHLEKDSVIMQQGERGQSFYIIASGTVRIEREDEAGQTHILARLGDGAFFGEMALLGDGLRSASVISASELDIFEISRDMLDELSRRFPGVRQVMTRFSKQRMLANLLNTSPLFAPFNPAERKALIEKFKSRPVADNTKIVKQGQDGDGLYVLLSGRAAVFVDLKGQQNQLGELGPGDIFGEMSLLKNAAVSATVQSLGPCIVLRLPVEIFRALAMSQPQILDLVSQLADKRTARNSTILHPIREQAPDFVSADHMVCI